MQVGCTGPIRCIFPDHFDNARVNKQENTSIFDRPVRKELALDERKAGEIFAAGVNDSSGCEKSRPNRTGTVILVKVFARRPDLLTRKES